MATASTVVFVIFGVVAVWLLCYFTDWTRAAAVVQGLRATERAQKWQTTSSRRKTSSSSTERSNRKKRRRHTKDPESSKLKQTTSRSSHKGQDEGCLQGTAATAAKLKEKVKSVRKIKETQLKMYNDILQWAVLPSARKALHNYVGSHEERKTWLRELLERFVSSNASELGDSLDQFFNAPPSPASSRSSREYPTLDELVMDLLKEENDQSRATSLQLTKWKNIAPLKHSALTIGFGKSMYTLCKKAVSKAAVTLTDLVPQQKDEEIETRRRRRYFIAQMRDQ